MNGDAAAAAGLHVVAPTDDARMGYDDMNIRGDELANHITTGGHAWSKISGKPTSYPPSAHNHDDRYYTETESNNRFATQNSFSSGRAVTDITGANNIGMRWNGSKPVFRVDGTEYEMARMVDVPSVGSNKANAYGDVNTVRHTLGPSGDAYNRTVSGGNFAVWMDSGLQFGRNVSSRRYKEDIEDHSVDASNVLALQPVTYKRKGVEGDEFEYGLIAEDVHETLPEIVTHFDGQIDGVRYDLLAVALLDVVKAQEARIAALEEKLEGGAQDAS